MLNRVRSYEISDKSSFSTISEDIIIWGLDPLNILANMLVKEVNENHFAFKGSLKTENLVYLANEIENYAEKLKDALEILFKNTADLISSDLHGGKEE